MLKFGLTAREGFVLAQLEGLVSQEAWRDVLEKLAEGLAATAASPRLVLDITGILGYLGIPERTAVGAMMAQNLGGFEKVAVVVQAYKITGVVSAEAQRQGLNLRMFPDFDDAVAWVSS